MERGILRSIAARAPIQLIGINHGGKLILERSITSQELKSQIEGIAVEIDCGILQSLSMKACKCRDMPTHAFLFISVNYECTTHQKLGNE